MSFFTFSQEVEAVKSGEMFIKESGMYDVKIKHAIYKKEEKRTYINFILEYNGGTTTVYQAVMLSVFQPDKGKVEENESGIKLLEKLGRVLDLRELSEPTRISIPLGKDNKMEDVDVIPEFSDMELTMHLRKQFEISKGKLYERLILRDVFRTFDKADAEEIARKAHGEEVEIGTKYNKQLPDSTKTIYRKCSEDEVKQLQSTGSNGYSSGGSEDSLSPSEKKEGRFN